MIMTRLPEGHQFDDFEESKSVQSGQATATIDTQPGGCICLYGVADGSEPDL